MSIERKYFKPLSLTWWSGIIPILIGFFIATVELHGLQSIVNAINQITGDISASVMITYGLTAIGLRGKDG